MPIDAGTYYIAPAGFSYATLPGKFASNTAHLIDTDYMTLCGRVSTTDGFGMRHESRTVCAECARAYVGLHETEDD